MPLKNTERDFAGDLLGRVAGLLPPEEKLWAEAIMGELASLSGGWRRLIWALGGCWGLGKIRMRSLLRSRQAEDGSRPAAVTLIVLYHGVFSCVILGVLIRQLPLIREPWTAAWFPVLCAFLVGLIPGVIALGLWVLDDAARYMAMAFSLLHALGNCAYLPTLQAGRWPLPVFRIVLDMVMIAALLLPSSRRFFRPPRVELHLES